MKAFARIHFHGRSAAAAIFISLSPLIISPDLYVDVPLYFQVRFAPLLVLPFVAPSLFLGLFKNHGQYIEETAPINPGVLYRAYWTAMIIAIVGALWILSLLIGGASPAGTAIFIRNLLAGLGLCLITARFLGAEYGWITTLAFAGFAVLFGIEIYTAEPKWWALVFQPMSNLGATVALLTIFFVGLFAYVVPRRPRRTSKRNR